MNETTINNTLKTHDHITLICDAVTETIDDEVFDRVLDALLKDDVEEVGAIFSTLIRDYALEIALANGNAA